MKIIEQQNFGTYSLLITESASRATQGKPVVLRLVKVPVGCVHKNARSPGVEVLQAWNVDARNTGPRSKYYRRLEDLKVRLSYNVPIVIPQVILQIVPGE